MESRRLRTIDDLLAWPGEERVELIDGDIVQRPMARFEHGLAQSALSDEIQIFKRRGGPDGWWIVTWTCPSDAVRCRRDRSGLRVRQRWLS